MENAYREGAARYRKHGDNSWQHCIGWSISKQPICPSFWAMNLSLLMALLFLMMHTVIEENWIKNLALLIITNGTMPCKAITLHQLK